MPVAILTGASKGLGRAVAAALAARGWSLVIDARDRPALDLAAAELARRDERTSEDGAASPGEVVAIAGDVADAAHRRELVGAAIRFGRLDLLVNNASRLGPSPQPALADYPAEEWEQVFRVDVAAPLALVQLTLPLLRASGGTVVNISSDAAVEPYPGWGGYGSAKAALDQLTAVLGAEEPGVHVYAFDPGDMRTQMHQAAFPGQDISDRPEPETVVPALLRLTGTRPQPPSGRYRASDLVPPGGTGPPPAGAARHPVGRGAGEPVAP